MQEGWKRRDLKEEEEMRKRWELLEGENEGGGGVWILKYWA